MGVLGGRGGGGGPGAEDTCRCAGSSWAYFPASGNAGGALKRGAGGGGGVGSCGGVGSLCISSVLPDLRGAGGGGGTPRRELVDDKLSEVDRALGAGGGGGARLWLPEPLTGAGGGGGGGG